MKLYVAGPMTGYQDFNAPLFNEVTHTLRIMGHEVVSPVEVDLANGLNTMGMSGDIKEIHAAQTTWGELLARDVKLLSDGKFDGIVLLPKWFQSKGVKVEVTIGLIVGLRFFYLTGGTLQEYNVNHIIDTLHSEFSYKYYRRDS